MIAKILYLIRTQSGKGSFGEVFKGFVRLA